MDGSIDHNGCDFKINLRNVEPFRWNTVNKLVKIPKLSNKEEFIITVVNEGKYKFRVSQIDILEKSPAN